jgi:hypothetical protein
MNGSAPKRSLGFAIISSVAEHRFLTTKQIARLHFHDHATDLAGIRACVRVLARLKSQRVLARLERAIGGVRAGSASFIWSLDTAGDRLTRRRILGSEAEVARRRVVEPSLMYQAHMLAVAEARVSLEEAARIGHFSIIQIQTEPDNWRTYTGPEGAPEILKPDLFVITADGEYQDHWFIEIDRGTESLPVLIRKSRQYEQYRRSGREQATRGVFPVVVWVLPHSGRRGQLEALLGRTRGLESSLFRVISPDELPTVALPPLEP